MKSAADLQNRLAPDFEERLAYVQTTVLPARGAHCGHCFGEGRDAALLEIAEGSGDPASHEKGDRLKAASTASVRGLQDVHCGHCFALGRELALKALNDWKPEEHLKPGHDLPKPGAPARPGQELPGAQPPAAATKPGEKPVHLPKPA